MPLDGEFALAYLGSQIAWDSEPALTATQQNDLFSLSRATDSAGVLPDATGYVETFTFESMDAVVYLGWTWKLSLAAELNEGDEKVIFDHCQKMVELWLSKARAILPGATAIVIPTFFTVASGTRGL